MASAGLRMRPESITHAFHSTAKPLREAAFILQFGVPKCQGKTRKATLLERVPLGVVTSIVPEVAPVGTVALMKLPDWTVNVAGAPLNVTLVAPVRLFPRILVLYPTLPNAGFALTKGPSPTVNRNAVPQPVFPLAHPPLSVVPCKEPSVPCTNDLGKPPSVQFGCEQKLYSVVSCPVGVSSKIVPHPLRRHGTLLLFPP